MPKPSTDQFEAFMPDKGNAFYDPRNPDQPWLFTPEQLGVRPRDLMLPERRYPRGYTPRRQQEVSNALQNTEFDVSTGQGMQADKEEESFIRQAITRSTIPADDLSELNRVVSHLPNEEYSGLGRYNPHAKRLQMGTFFGADRAGGSASISDNPNDASKILIHELGHHADRDRRSPKLSSYGKSRLNGASQLFVNEAARRGSNEANANNYMDTHHVDDPRFPASTLTNPHETAVIDALIGSTPEDVRRGRHHAAGLSGREAGQFTDLEAASSGKAAGAYVSAYAGFRRGKQFPVMESQLNAINHAGEPTLFDTPEDTPTAAAPSSKPSVTQRIMQRIRGVR